MITRDANSSRARLRRLLLTQAATFLGDSLLMAGFPLLAVHVTRSPALVSTVGASATLPWLVASLPSGLLTDRQERRKLMATAGLIAALLLFALAASIAAGVDDVPLLDLVAFIVGCLQVVVGNVGSTIVPEVVRDSALTSANAKLFVAQQIVGQFFGPPLAGILITLALVAPTLVAASCYALASLVLVTWRVRFDPGSPTVSRTSVWRDLTSGLHTLLRHRQLRAFAFTTATLNLAIQAILSVLVIYAVSPGPLKLSRAGYGILLATFAIGGVAGAPLSGPLARLMGRGHLLVVAVVIFGCGLGLPALWPQPIAVGVELATVGAAATIYNVTTVTYRQRVIPSALLGRVTSAYRLFGYGALPIGAALGGAVASNLGIRSVFGASAIIAFLACFLLSGITEKSLHKTGADAGHFSLKLM